MGMLIVRISDIRALKSTLKEITYLNIMISSQHLGRNNLKSFNKSIFHRWKF